MKTSSIIKHYKEMDKLVKQKGGIIFIVRRLENKGRAIITDDNRQSPIFEFNINYPAGLSMLFECDKALADQAMAYLMKDVFWLGEPVDMSGLKYIVSTGDRVLPVPQIEMIRRVNKVVDKCMESMLRSTKKYGQVHIEASNRMISFLEKTDLGVSVKELYPQLFE